MSKKVYVLRKDKIFHEVDFDTEELAEIFVRQINQTQPNGAIAKMADDEDKYICRECGEEIKDIMR